jgi:sugar transferase EpsL
MDRERKGGVAIRVDPNWKRGMDLVLGGVALLVTLPLCGVIALWIKLTSKGPVFFRQLRPGLGGQPFTLLKFRTMTEARDDRGNNLPDAMRLTRFGRFLRSTSLDELPELIHVLRGEMSLVGPRPLLMQYLPRYTPEQNRRHDVKPGMTGWAQVNGRNAITWEQKFALDVWYVDHSSFGIDCKIIFLTVLKVLSGAGISQPGHATMEEFKG